jgi:RNA polymerase sigma factor (sigma-70 family)
MMMNDQQILLGCKKKEKRAQQSLYERYSGMLLGICVRYATDVPEAEDILQESLLKIYLNIGKYSGEGSFIGWMRKIVVNTAITHYHKNLKHKRYVDIEEVFTSEAGKEDFPDTPFTAEELKTVLDQLPKGYKTVFNLYAIEGYKHKEIAKMLDIDVNTSKSQYSRARSFIQKKLENYK